MKFVWLRNKSIAKCCDNLKLWLNLASTKKIELPKSSKNWTTQRVSKITFRPRRRVARWEWRGSRRSGCALDLSAQPVWTEDQAWNSQKNIENVLIMFNWYNFIWTIRLQICERLDFHWGYYTFACRFFWPNCINKLCLANGNSLLV